MTKILLLTCFFFLPFLIFPQQKPVKADSAKAGGLYLDASAGLSLPLGSFADANIKSSGSGFATPGFLAQLDLDWIGKDNYGLAVQYTFQHNSIKNSVRNDTLTGMYQAIGTGAWSNHYILAGIVFLKFIQKFYIEGRVLFGVVLSSSPLFNTVDPVNKIPSTNLGTGIAYGVQLGAGYAVSPRVTVKANIEYILGNPKIHHQYGAEPIGVDTLTGAIIYSPPLNTETKKTVSALMVKAGVVIKLSK